MPDPVHIPVRLVPGPSAAADPEEDNPSPAAAPGPELTEVEQLERERDRCLALASRTQTDFDEYRRRSRRDLAEARENALADFLKTLLPAFDDLDRSLAAEDSTDANAPHLEGFRLCRQNLQAALQAAGVSPVPAALGQAFDPTIHDAIATDTRPGFAPGTLVEVHQPGYRLGERLLRPARVIVAAAPR